jgi:hypothetical protein
VKTVKDIKNFVLRESGVRDAKAFCKLSDAHRAFYVILNKLGCRGMPEDPSEPLPSNIDEAALLTEYEERQLLADFHSLGRNGTALVSLRSKTLLSSQ